MGGKAIFIAQATRNYRACVLCVCLRAVYVFVRPLASVCARACMRVCVRVLKKYCWASVAAIWLRRLSEAASGLAHKCDKQTK
jgi:disulfide bond formation protein DsbB